MIRRRRKHTSAAAIACALVLALSACTSGEDEASDGSSTTPTTAEVTTTAAPPVIRGLGESLGLIAGQCYDDVPEPTTTTLPPTTLPATSEGETTTEPPPPPTTEPPPITTTIPRPPLVAIVECGGTNAGVVFATFCIGSLAEEGELVDMTSELGTVECDGDPDLAWPGDRLLRRAAARECVVIFESVFDEPYALSDIGTTEFVPSRSVWERGDRRIVCTADQI